MDRQEELSKEWLKLKAKEKEFADKRKKLELEIEELFPFSGSLSKSFKFGKFKVNIKKNVAYKLDQDQWKEIRTSIPIKNRPEKLKYDLDVKKYEKIRESGISYFNAISDCVEVKNNKTTIKIEREG